MEENLRWYKEKKLDRLCKILLDKGYLIHRVFSAKEAKEKIDSFWNALFKAVSEEKRVMFKDWGVFEEKDVKSRKIVIPRQLQEAYTQPKKVLKFRAGGKLIQSVNKRGENIE